jgi:hypothetical protein
MALPVRQRAGEGGFRTVGPPVREQRFSRLPPHPHRRPPTVAPPLRDRRFADSPVEEAGFEPSVPREAPRIVVVSVLVRADFSACGNQAEVT